MYRDRIGLYRELEAARGSKVLAFVTGDRPLLETQIHTEVYDFFVNHLDKVGIVPKISMYLYTRGGDTLAAWSLVNLIKQFCTEFEVIVPSKALSSGTLICLGSNRIVMTKQATLGPIDPSINTPLNPGIPGGQQDAKYPVSVEAINGFLELAKEQLKINNPDTLSSLLMKLADYIHPLVLGQVYRSKSQIQMLARKLIMNQVQDPEKIDAVISFLCSESGSHDYAIHRREARDHLGLMIEKPDDLLYKLIKKIYDNIVLELEMNSKFDPNTFIGQNNDRPYELKRALIETIDGGSDYFVSEGTLIRQQIPTPQGLQLALQDQRHFEGWRHENA